MTDRALSSFVHTMALPPAERDSAETESADRLHSLRNSNAGKAVYRLGALSGQPTFRDRRLWVVLGRGAQGPTCSPSRWVTRLPNPNNLG